MFDVASSQLLSRGPFELDPQLVQEHHVLLKDLQQQYSSSLPASSSGVLATRENRKKYAVLCSQWIDSQVSPKRIPFSECILGMFSICFFCLSCLLYWCLSLGKFRPVTHQRIRELADRIIDAGGVLFNTPGMVRPARDDEQLANPGTSWVIIGGNTRATVLPVLYALSLLFYCFTRCLFLLSLFHYK